MFDIAFAVILCITSLLAFIKGFLKSFFSLVNWVLASVASYFVTPFIASFFVGQLSYLGLHAIFGTVSFVVFLIILSIITGSISKTLLTVLPQQVDKSFGFAFGFAKGYAIITLVFSIITAVYANDFGVLSNKTKAEDGRYGPSWLMEAKSYKLLILGADFWQPLINKVVTMAKDPVAQGNIKDKFKDQIGDKIKEIEDDTIEGGVEGVIKKMPGGGSFDKIKKIQDMYKNIDSDLDQGYRESDIEKKNRLMETIE